MTISECDLIVQNITWKYLHEWFCGLNLITIIIEKFGKSDI